MAYKIGSDRGKRIAEAMAVDTKWTNDVDGSVWEKKADGSITVTTDKGEKFDNAYKPTTTANSQYSINDYNDAGMSRADKAYINAQKIGYSNAIAAGDQALADIYRNNAEARRALYGYSGGEDGSQYIPLGGTPNTGLSATDILNWGNLYNNTNAQPIYNGKYDAQINAKLNELLNRKDFSYNIENDPMYQQYSEIYQREGDRAMRETLAEAAAGAGGMNSYAVTAAQQAANYYNSQLNDKIPELYQLAYSMYLDDIDREIQDLGLLQSMDATQYNRYRDTMSDWRNDKNFAYGLYSDALAQNNWQNNFDYGVYTDDRNFVYNDFLNNRELEATEKARADEQLRYIIDKGGTPSAELIEQAGWTPDEVSSAIAAEKAKTDKQNALTDAEIYKLINSVDKELGYYGDGGAGNDEQLLLEIKKDLGLPSSLNDNILSQLESEGAIYEDKDGTMKWAKGWSKDNYLNKLSGIGSLL